MIFFLFVFFTDDIMHGDLTVWDCLYYNAVLRLSQNMKHSQKQLIVNDVIKLLRLEDVRYNIIGSVEKRGISGGHRKRVNIGMELVAFPSIFCLDEPTSGLDASSAYEVVKALQKLAHEFGITVVAIIHQPRYAVWVCTIKFSSTKNVYFAIGVI